MHRGVPFKKLVEVEEAVMIVYKEIGGGLNERILEEGVRDVKLEDLPGRLAGEDVYAPIPLPWYPKSLLDGCAVRSVDVATASKERPVELLHAGRVKIGHKPGRDLGEGECIEVDTGSWLPRGADAVIPVEELSFTDGRVIVEKSVEPGNGIAWPSTDVASGDQVIERGRPFSPESIAALAALGLDSAPASRRVRVTVFSTGVELADPGSLNVEPRSIESLPVTFDSNRAFIRASLESMGLEVRDAGIVGDSLEEAEEAILRSAEEGADIIISSGGTSAGVDDTVFKAVGRLGKLLVHGIRIKPGKPTLLGVLPGNRLFIGLPGNPRSVINVFYSVVLPLLSALSVIPSMPEKRFKAASTVMIVPSRGRRSNIPVASLGSGPLSVESFVPVAKESYMIASFAKADGYLVLGQEVNAPLRPGSMVEVSVNRPSRRTLLALTDTPKTQAWAPKFNVKVVYYPVLDPAPMIESLPTGALVALGLPGRLEPEQVRVSVVEEYARRVVVYHNRGSCERIALYASYQRYARNLQGIKILSPRAETAKILVEQGYVDCALLPNDYEPRQYKREETIGEENVYLAVRT